MTSEELIAALASKAIRIEMDILTNRPAPSFVRLTHYKDDEWMGHLYDPTIWGGSDFNALTPEEVIANLKQLGVEIT